MAETTTSEARTDGDNAPPSEARSALKWVTIVLWLPLLIAALAGPVVSIAVGMIAFMAEPIETIGLHRGDDGVVPFSAEAKRMGLKHGDELIAVDGVPLDEVRPSDANGKQSAFLFGPDGTIIRATFRSTDGTIRAVSLTKTTTHVVELYAGSGLSPDVAAAATAGAGALGAFGLIGASAMLFRRSRQKPVPLLLSFGLLGLSLGWFGLVMFNASGFGFLRLPTLISAWSLIILALMLFPDGRFSPRWMRWIALLLVLVTPFGASAMIDLTIWPLVHTAFLLGAVASLIYRYRRLPPGPERLQIRWVFFGFATAALMLLPTLALERTIFIGNPPLAIWVWGALLDQILIALMAVTIAGGLIVSLFKYRLYDADKVIARSVSFGALALVLVALFAGTERVIELAGEEFLGERLGVLAGGIGAGIAALMIVPLHHRLTHWTENRFRRELLRLRQGLPALVGDLRETAPVRRIAAAALDWVMQGTHASRAALLLEGEVAGARHIAASEIEEWQANWTASAQPGLDSDRADEVFPLRVPLEADGHGRIGWLLLGPRPDGSFYDRDEREVLAHIADPVARALEIAHEREARDAAERERWQGQEKLNAELLRVLGSLDGKLERLIPPPVAAAE